MQQLLALQLLERTLHSTACINKEPHSTQGQKPDNQKNKKNKHKAKDQ
jgi:hypothetical protein